MSRRGWVVFAAVSALWGAPYLLIKVALADFPPPTIVFGRTAIGAALLVPLAARRGRWREVRGRWAWLIVLALLEMAAPFILITLGEQRIASSLAGILVASAPLFVAVLAVFVAPDHRPRGLGLVGMLAGFTGVVVLLGIDVGASASALLGATLVLVASVLYAAGGLLLSARMSGASPIAVMAGVSSFAALILLVPALADLPRRAPSIGPLGALVGLGLGCTGAAFVGFAALTAEIGPARASVVAYVAPAFAVILGAVFRSEAITVSTLAGFALILAGSWLAAGARSRGRSAEVR